ncbi:MAG TPA: GAF domain-containing protein [Burkholderiales bacterium]|nr:GAF domain-containing protein [Burkholderiales bacterium]
MQRGRLFRRYFLLILALVCGALLISGGIGLYFSYQENKVALASLQHEKALSAAARIEQFVLQIEQQLAYAALPQLGVEGLEQRRIEFLKLLRVVHAVTDITQIDAKGKEQLSVSRLKMDESGTDRDWSGEPAFKNARPGQTWYGPVYFRKETEPYMSIAVRSGGEAGAVTVAEVNLKFIWDVVTRIKVGQKGKAYVVDSSGHLVADPDIGLVLRKTDMAGLEQVKAALQPDSEDSLAMLAKDLTGSYVLTAFAPIEPARDQPLQGTKPTPLGWKVFVEQPVSEVYQALDATVIRTVALLVAGLLFSALVAMWLARSMARPISVLQEGAQRIGAGDLESQISIKTGDELESLADQFNRMTAQLRESYAGLERKVEERTTELKQALEQQTAISEILRVISNSPSDVQPVLDAVVERAARICEAQFADIVLADGAVMNFAASIGDIGRPDSSDRTVPIDRTTVMGRSMVDRQPVHVADLQSASEKEFPRGRPMALQHGHRTILALPLLRENKALGTIVLRRREVRPFEAKHIELLKTFADQAAIAIENVRLFNETKESLDQQTAISEVLRVISSTPSDVTPVLDAVADRANRLCDSAAATIYVLEGTALRRTAFRGPDDLMPGESLDFTDQSLTGRTIADGKVIHVPDIEKEQHTYPRSWQFAQKVGNHTMLSVPLMREGNPFGTMFLRRREVRPFNEKEISLAATFANQAAIAIENVRLFKEIQEKSAQLEIANKHKSEFLANMSHELRTPLNAIIGFSEVLIDKMFGEVNEKQADYLKDIHESGKHLLSLINDILDLSKIEAGRMDLDLSTFHLPTALSNAMTLIRERAQRHSIALGLDVDPRLGEFEADERKVKQILLNLLSNAVKFTPDGGRVDVSAKMDTTKVAISVKDTGIGIAPEDQSAVFEEFKQVGRDYTRKAEGTGLGLALTKRFVELHGGEISLASAPGKGSTFTITLPIRQ